MLQLLLLVLLRHLLPLLPSRLGAPTACVTVVEGRVGPPVGTEGTHLPLVRQICVGSGLIPHEL